MQCRRKGGGFCLGVTMSGDKVECADVELEKKSFASLVREAQQLLQKEATGDQADTKPEVVFAWGRNTADFSNICAEVWKVREEEGSSGHILVSGTSLEEEMSFQLCWQACAKIFETDVWQVPVFPSSSLDRVREWGRAPLDFASHSDSAGKLLPVPCLIAERAQNIQAEKRQQLGALAVAGKNFQISYEELYRRTASVAQVLMQQADPKKPKAVLVCMGRGEAIAPTFLGILAAGFYVVPVDIHWPQDRILQVAEECNACLAFAEAESLKLLDGTSMKALVIDSSFYAHAQGPAQMEARELAQISSEDIAVILFTSGSSGKPKGILLSHGYLTALVLGIAASKRMDMLTKTLCYHSPTWMPFLDYLFCPLVVGGCCLFFPDDGHVVKPAELAVFAEQHGATSAGFVPAVLDILAEEGIPPSLSDIGVGGAAVPSKLCTHVLPLMQARPDGSPATLYTGYSGTEQGDVTQIRMRCEEDVERAINSSGFMGAGRVHTGQTMVLLDSAFGIVGPSAIGEITISGPGLASGYLNLPEKTSETFLTSCEALMGARAVRSGDLGKWTEAGQLILVGRRDSMVKVRGARIELGEVEGTISAHPAVKACIVTVLEDKLVVYVSPAVPADLRDFCKGRLVAYMVPHIFEGLEELPRLPNGKVNKKLLPKPEERADGAEAVMELDSLGQMRKFTRASASEDRVLDNVRAILIALVIQSHSVPLLDGATMITSTNQTLPAQWGPMQLFVLNFVRGGGWSSLAFLSGFDDTRAEKPYSTTYREPVFICLWLLLDFNHTMWYLPVFAYMRIVFCSMHKIGLEKTHIVLASQIWILLPAFVDFYMGWDLGLAAGDPGQDQQAELLGACPAHCVCPWQESPWLQDVAHYSSGWWVTGPVFTANSYVGHGMIFIPCYWLGFYYGSKIFKVLTKLADETSPLRRLMTAGIALAVYLVMFTGGHFLSDDFDDRCSAFWSPGGSFMWGQVLQNLLYYASNLFASLIWVVFIASAVPIHLKYLAKICFASLIISGLTPGVLDMPSMALELRRVLPSSISPGVEILWTFLVAVLFELVVGAVVTTILPIVIKAGMGLTAKISKIIS
ncbi:unnamed protein product [Polarella glacialis]|uniref:AMP-dependent synthetase/ligase domain-containing protein n=1 Tax=Polarella glacialis TaxID=89957 RepID=A0A813J6F9_POLGL|nr:unnamed protein product [Polarella glacialis]